MQIPACNTQMSPGLAYPIEPGSAAKGGTPGLGKWQRPLRVGVRGIGQIPGYDVPLQINQPGTSLPTITSQPAGFWASVLPGLFKTGETIALNVTQPRGVYTQTGPGGTITYVQPSGTQPSILQAAAGTGAFSGQASPGLGMVLLAGVGVFLVLAIAGRGGKR